MKTNRLFSLLCLSVIFLSAYAFTPKTETSNIWMRITDVERTDSSLRVGVRLQNYPHYWVMLSPNTRLIAREDTTLQYKLIATENIQTDKRIWMPESGRHEGVLVFEKVPDEVKIVDMVESNPADVNNSTYGIELDPPATQVLPDIITMADIMNDGKKPTETWSGPDPKRYADMSFYDKNGKAHIRGRITDYSPRYGVTTFSVNTTDDFTASKKTNVGDVNPDGTFEIDIPLTYPQFDLFSLGNIFRNIFLVPGDTLDIVTSMAIKVDPRNGYVPDIFGFEGMADDAVAINMLTDSLFNRYEIQSLYKKYKVEDTDSMKSETYRQNKRLAALLDSVCEDLPDVLGDIPASVFAKDMAAIATIGEICEAIEDIQMSFKLAKGSRLAKSDNGEVSFTEGENLDDISILTPWLRHKDLIYNNPLLVCTGWVLPSRWKFNSQFRPSAMAAKGLVEIPGTDAYMSSDDMAEINSNDFNRLDSIGLGNCFVAQFARTSSLIDKINTTDKPSSANLNRNNRLVANTIKNNEYDRLSEILMSEYNNFVKDVMIAENKLDNKGQESTVIPDSPEGNVLAKIIEPFKGNVLFLDFWGIGCGPCRAGMMDQKPLLERMADKPFKALYIANASQGMEACKKWLRKEEIKGEHIFVSNDDWNRLSGLFNFSAIPFGVLIGKDGNIIKTDYHIHEKDPLLKKALKD